MTDPGPPLHALVVGIDRYGEPPAGGFAYPSLYGAVADAMRVEEYLREDLGVPGERLRRLVAPHAGGDPRELPTRERLAAALIALERDCRPREHALVYYSGHGGRVPTLVPEIKGRDGLDEVLAPADACDPAVPYLRDVEIAAWLGRCAARGIFVTLILDCCHSGGAVRRDRRVRGSDEVDRTPRPVDRLLADRGEIAAVWKAAPAIPSGSRLEVVPVRARSAEGYAVLAACRPHERAVEVEAAGAWFGIMTHHLLAALRRTDEPGMTYRRLHATLTTRLHADGYLGQTPMIDGEADRPFLGRTRLPGGRGVEVLETEGWPGERIRLAIGQLHGLRGGERFRIVPRGAAGVDDPSGRFTEAEIVDVGQTSAWARPSAPVRGAPAVRAGDSATLVDHGPLALRRTVAWVAEHGDRGPGCDRHDWLARLLEEHGAGFLAPAPPGARGDFEVAVHEGLLEIRDAGGTPIPHLGSPLPLIAPGSGRELVRRLGHLARYWAVRSLENPEPTSPLAGTLRLRIEPVAEPGSPERSEAGEGGTCVVPSGTRVRLTLDNLGTRVFNVAVLDLQPDWGIRQIVPHRDAAPWETLEPRFPLSIELGTHLPDGFEEGVDVLKAIAATGPFDLASVERPPVASPPVVLRGRPGSRDGEWGPFGRLIAALGAERAREAVLRSGRTATESWTTAEGRVQVGRSAAAVTFESDKPRASSRFHPGRTQGAKTSLA